MDAKQGQRLEARVVVVGQEQPGVEATQQDRPLVIAGVFVGERRFRHAEESSCIGGVFCHPSAFGRVLAVDFELGEPVGRAGVGFRLVDERAGGVGTPFCKERQCKPYDHRAFVEVEPVGSVNLGHRSSVRHRHDSARPHNRAKATHLKPTRGQGIGRDVQLDQAVRIRQDEPAKVVECRPVPAVGGLKVVRLEELTLVPMHARVPCRGRTGGVEVAREEVDTDQIAAEEAAWVDGVVVPADCL